MVLEVHGGDSAVVGAASHEHALVRTAEHYEFVRALNLTVVAILWVI